MNTAADSLQQRMADADRLGADAVARTLEEAAATLAVDAPLAARMVASARAEAQLRHAASLPAAAGDDGFDFATVHAPSPGRFDPKVVQLRLAPLIASACGAVGSMLGALTPVGWGLVALSAAIALRDFWKKKVTFDGVHGQLLYEMFRITDEGISHAVPADVLFASVNAARAGGALPALLRSDFDFALGLLLSNGILGLRTADGTLEWAETTIELVA